MYEAYFNLQSRPFSATPDSSCFFAPEAIQETLDQLVLRAEAGEGIGVVTGDAGTGKTLLCRRVAAELAPRMTPVFLPNSNFSTRRALLQTILFELGRKYSGLEEQELRLAIFGMLRELTLVGRGAVLIVDEAHLLNDRLLEELRLMSCLAEEGQPLARLILAGQPALEERLVSPTLEALNQRIACQLFLEPLTRHESIEYVEYRIAWAGGQTSRLFDEGALDNIATASAGLPRCLNQLCDHSLLLAFVHEQSRVTAEIVAEALLDLRQLPLHWNTPVMADSSVTVLQEEIAEADSDADLDYEADADDALPVSNAATCEPSLCADTVCFEVGGDDEEVDEDVDVTDDGEEQDSAERQLQDEYSESVSLAGDHRPSVVAASDTVLPAQDTTISRKPARCIASPTVVTWQAILQDPQEERLVDRYAMLDAGMPRLVRTFDDAPVPANWQPVKCSDVPAAPQPPEVPVVADDEGRFEIERLVDAFAVEPGAAAHPVFAELDEVEPALDETVDFLPDQPVDAALAADWRFADSTGEDRPEIEDLLAASVTEACREVQAAVGRWHEEDISSPAGTDSRSLEGILEDVVLPEPVRQYDVIEPDLSAGKELHRDLVRDDDHSSVQSAGRYVPKPKYRMIFSTLRRRLGRGR